MSVPQRQARYHIEEALDALSSYLHAQTNQEPLCYVVYLKFVRGKVAENRQSSVPLVLKATIADRLPLRMFIVSLPFSAASSTNKVIHPRSDNGHSHSSPGPR